jgi:GNAT superfamily N-acetyltransferase
VRRASPDDSAAVVPLLVQLGYRVELEQLAARFDRAADRDAAWVAEQESAVVGFAGGHRFDPFELDAPVAEITPLVVDESHRGGGVGRELVATFESWAVEAGCVRLSVATGFHRTDAHAFYERLGYEQHARKYEKTTALARRVAV